jgi:hypothetical protein
MTCQSSCGTLAVSPPQVARHAVIFSAVALL